LEGDIKGCFDHISHEWLLKNVLMDKKVLRQWLKSGFMENGTLHDTDEGTPQGGIISPVLANLALDGLESSIKEAFPKERKIHFIRYADDFIITGATKEILENKVKPMIEGFIRERGLELSGEKTRITHISEGFDFLGQNIRKYNGKLLIKPSEKNVRNFLQKVMEMVKENLHASPINLIWKLNPMIRGWANFHRHVVSKEIYQQVDFEITRAIWKWARRRHSNKSRSWIKKRYFRMNEQGRDWNFFGRKNGKEAALIKAGDVKIKRHVKVKGQSNPYDPEWEVYFENRLYSKTAETLKGYRKIYRLWQEQDGNCPVCRQKFAGQNDWHKHHIKWKVNGGENTIDNLVLLHPNCHRQVHSRKLKVEKLRSSRSVRKA